MSISYCYVTQPCNYCGSCGEITQRHTKTNGTIRVEIYCSHCGLIKNTYEYTIVHTPTPTPWTIYKPNNNL